MSMATHRTVKLVKKMGIHAHFTHRDFMRRKTPRNRFRGPHGVIPATTLPVDSFGSPAPSFNMDANDSLGICGPAMCQHVDVILNWRLGKGSQPANDVNKLIQQYEQYSGGDNGTDEDMLVGPQGMWTAAGGGLEGDLSQVVDDSLDIDVTNAALAQYAIDQFFAVELAWSVPDDFLNNFTPGSVWLSPGNPDPNNGHYTPLANVDAGANYTLITWGATCTVSPMFVASVQPATFVAFSRQQFDPKTGLDAKGRHVSEQGAKWVTCGGSAAKAAAVVALFPPLPAPTPAPTPGPQPTPAPAALVANVAPVSVPVTVSGNLRLLGNVTLTGTVQIPGQAASVTSAHAAKASASSIIADLEAAAMNGESTGAASIGGDFFFRIETKLKVLAIVGIRGVPFVTQELIDSTAPTLSAPSQSAISSLASALIATSAGGILTLIEAFFESAAGQELLAAIVQAIIMALAGG